MRYIKYVETKLGKIGIVEKDNKIVKVIIINGKESYFQKKIKKCL